MRYVSLLTVYIFAAFLTFGYVHNSSGHMYPEAQRLKATAAGIVWPLYWGSYPLYWAGDFAIEVTK